MPASAEPTSYRLGPCRFHPRSHELWRDGQCLRLPRRLSQLLQRLVASAPEVVTRQTLLDEVWERRMVEDEVLSRAIAELRRVFDDDPKAPLYIETIPKAGYRFIAEVSAVAEDEPPIVSAAVPEADAVNAVVPSRSRAGRLAATGAAALVVAAMAGLWWSRGDPAASGISAADMARARPLTSAPGWEFRPDVSADGRWVAYAQSEAGATDAVLVLQDIADGHREILESQPRSNLRPAFSSDGRRLAFLHVEPGSCELRVRTLPGGPGRKLARCAADVAGSPSWSTDQKQIVFSAPAIEGRAAGLAVVDVEHGTVRQLSSPSVTEGPDRDAEFIPGDEALTFARGYDGEQHLMRMPLGKAGAPAVVLWDAGRLQGHAWRADGRQLIVASDQPGYRALVLLDADGRLVEVLGARGARFPAWSASGELVFESAQYDANIWRLDLDDTDVEPRSVVASTRYDASPVLSADGRRLAFVSTRNDFEQIFVANVDGSDQQRLPMPDGQRWSRPSFSPDGAYVLVTGYDADNRHWIYRHELASGRNEQLLHLGAESSGGQYAADGRFIVYLRRAPDGRRNLWQVATAGDAEPMPVRYGEGVDQFVLGDGFVVFNRVAEAGFHLLSLSDHAPAQPLLSEVQPISAFAWALRGRRVYAVVVEEGATVLRRWDIDSGTTERIATAIDADAIGPALAISADERTIWFARTDSVSVDLMRVPARPR